MATLTPLQQQRPVVLRDTLSGRFVQSGRRQTADVLVGSGVSKRRPMSDEELAARKKAQGYISRTTTTHGQAALGAKGLGWKAGRAASAAQGTRHGVTAARRAKSWNNRSLNLAIVGSGVGGVGGYNFASYTAEDGRRQRNIKKNWSSGMDFGLSSVQQGTNLEEISKAGFSYGGPARLQTVKSTAREVRRGPQLLASSAAPPPRARAFDPKNPWGDPPRKSRKKAYIAGGATAAGAAGAGGTYYAVKKAYDPERNRNRRLDAYANGAMVGSGALGTGALYYGNKAIGRKRTVAAPPDPRAFHPKTRDLRDEKGPKKGSKAYATSGKVTSRTGLRAVNDIPEFRGGIRNAGKAVGLAAGAAGLAVGSHRIRQYKNGRGRTYKPMRQIEY